MKTAQPKKKRKPVWPVRRLCQLVVVAVLVLVPFYSNNAQDWVPSRIVQGQLPPPTTFPVNGDTWSFAMGDFLLVHPVAFIENLMAIKVLYLPILSAVLLPLALTMVLGRIFCSWLCPVGLVLELNMRAGRMLERLGWHRHIRIPDFRYPLLAVCLIFAFIFSMPLIAVFDPPHVLGRELMYLFSHHQVSIMGTGLLLCIVLFELFGTSRAWCRFFCPSGGCLALLGRARLWRIHLDPKRCTQCQECDARCPYDLEPMRLVRQEMRFDWTTCDNCGRCRDVCATGAISYRWGIHKATVKN